MRKATIALDVHKRETQACIVDRKGNVLEEKRFRTTPRSYARVLSAYEATDVIIESVGMHRPVVRWIREQGHVVHMANTSRIPKPRVKTDKKDARHLARLYQADALPESWIAPEDVQKLRDLARQRQYLGQRSRQLRSKIMHDLLKHGHFFEKNPVETELGRAWIRKQDLPEVESTLNVVEQVEEEIGVFQEKLEELTTKNPTALRLTTIPGVAEYTAMLLVAEVGDFHRFEKGDALAGYAGLGVRQDQSGDKDRRGSITKEGNSLLRWALVEAARNHVRVCPKSTLSRRYAKLAKKKGHKSALVSTARVLATVIWAMTTRKEDFKVNP